MYVIGYLIEAEVILPTNIIQNLRFLFSNCCIRRPAILRVIIGDLKIVLYAEIYGIYMLYIVFFLNLFFNVGEFLYKIC